MHYNCGTLNMMDCTTPDDRSSTTIITSPALMLRHVLPFCRAVWICMLPTRTGTRKEVGGAASLHETNKYVAGHESQKPKLPSQADYAAASRMIHAAA